MKLLICTQKVDETDSNLGFFVRWIEEFAKHCERVIVICLEKGEHNLPKNVRVLTLGKMQNAKCKTQNTRDRNPFAFCLLPFARLRYAMRFFALIWRERRQYDAVFVHMNPEYVLLGGSIWKFFGKNVGLWYTHRSMRLLRVVLPFLDHIFTASQDSFPIQTPKLHVMGHGIDVKHFTAKAGMVLHNPPIILSDTRLSRSKHVERTIEISRLLLVNKIPHEMRIIGAAITEDDESCERELHEEVATEKLPIVFCGGMPYKELPTYYGNADIFINHGNIGALNKTVLQAMSADLYVLTSNESYRGILPDEQIISPDPRSFVEKIKDFMASPTTVHYREKVLAEHSLTALIPRILALYEL